MVGKNIIWKNLAVFGIIHVIVDMICAGIIFNYFFIGTREYTIFNLIILYSVIAFGLQAIFGLICDFYRKPKLFSIIGLIFIGLGTIMNNFSYLTIILIGIGNAMFHIGAGTISLNLNPKKASSPGIFVAPGAIGLFIGTLLGKTGYFNVILGLILVILSISLIYYIKIPKIDYEYKNQRKNYLELIILFILLSIIVRSYIGLILVFPWKSNLFLVILMTLGVFFGKSLGGILGDKFGWIKVSVICLIISGILLSFFINDPILGIIGIFLFNMPMAITLTEISNNFPGRPGFSFGMTCLALCIGALIAFYGGGSLLNEWEIFGLILLSAGGIWAGLRL